MNCTHTYKTTYPKTYPKTTYSLDIHMEYEQEASNPQDKPQTEHTISTAVQQKTLEPYKIASLNMLTKSTASLMYTTLE